MSEPLSDPSATPSTADPRTSGSGTALLDRELLGQPVEPGDHERYAHYVRKEKVLESALSGEPVIALCGKVWVPGRDPNKFPVCPVCKEVIEGMRSREGSSAGGGRGPGAGE